ncbi:MAG: UbiD family decarboxylase, partial [Mariprofundaceae bacterium]|nr:UbiD family decarboxylase [Mariprofundaceae bacterium]
MSLSDLRSFIQELESKELLKRIDYEVSSELEITEISDRVLKAGGPALLFEHVKGYSMPVLTNLFGTAERIALGMGRESADELRGIGELLAYLKEPEPPKGFKDAWSKFPLLKKVLDMHPKS